MFLDGNGRGLGIKRAPGRSVAMSGARPLPRTPFDDTVRVDSGPSHPPSGRRLTARDAASPLDPLEEALVSRRSWDLREPDGAVHELLVRFAVGDEAGAIVAADRLLVGRRVPALTVSLDIVDEIELDHCAALVLAYIDGMTDVSHVLNACGLPRAEALRTLCALIERRIVMLRAAR
jgi:hypothetical protein